MVIQSHPHGVCEVPEHPFLCSGAAGNSQVGGEWSEGQKSKSLQLPCDLTAEKAGAER